jgi:lantibiotic modifying enzyme
LNAAAAVDAADAADAAERSWAWVLDQVRWDDDGPWVGTDPLPASERDTVYEGVAGLAFALAEVRLARDWSPAESVLAEAVVDRLVRISPNQFEASLYCGLAGSLTAIALLDRSAIDAPVHQLQQIVTESGWPTTLYPDRDRAVLHDVLVGNAGIVLATAWLDDPRANDLVTAGCDALLRGATETSAGLSWPIPGEFTRGTELPNYSHGTAGVATALAVAGRKLRRADWVEAARLGAQHVLALADLRDGGCRVPHYVPHGDHDEDPYTYGWCHGPTGTQHMFVALARAGVESVSGSSCTEVADRCLFSVIDSGVPARVRPGFWDNDGRCCGTAGVGDVFLDYYQGATDGQADVYLGFADTLAQALIDRAVPNPSNPAQVYWQFVEHRRQLPLLDPTAGWMQGAAGISAYLFRHARVKATGRDATRLSLPDNL